jgi:hypothetical protein
VLCSNVVRHTEANGLNVFYYFCSYLGDSSESCSRLLRSLASQIIQKHPDLAIYVYDMYFESHPKSNTKAMADLLPKLLQGVGSARFVIDGVDEWDARDQDELLKHLEKLLSTDPSSYICKILISSRDTLEVSRSLSRKSKTIAFSFLSDRDESVAVNHSISRFVDAKLAKLPSHFDDLDPQGLILARTKQKLLNKSNGSIFRSKRWIELIKY